MLTILKQNIMKLVRWFHASRQLIFTRPLSLFLLRRLKGSKYDEKSSWVEIKTGRSHLSYHHGRNRHSIIIASWNGLDWKEPLISTSSNPSAIGRDTSLQTRLLTDPSSLAFQMLFPNFQILFHFKPEKLKEDNF